MKIYRYLDTNGAIATLKSSSVLLKCPVEYNDPFDGLFYLTEKERKKAYSLFENYYAFKELYKFFFIDKNKPIRFKGYANLLKKNIELIALNVRKTGRYCYERTISIHNYFSVVATKKALGDFSNEFNKLFDAILKMIREQALVCCFGSDNKSILLWSHYAEDHKGACIEYEVPDDGTFSAVEYRKKLPVFQLTKALSYFFGNDFANEKMRLDDAAFRFVLKPLLTKSTDWKYEKEYRCILSKDEANDRRWSDGKYNLFRMPKPTKVYLGCKATRVFEKKIKEFLGDVPLVRMKMSADEYGVENE